MQLGCAALDDSIQVSDQPVAPSFGTVVLTGCLSAVSRLAVYCQIEPTCRSPCVKPCCCLVMSAQNWPISGRCFFSSATAASNCVWSSS